MFLSCRTSKGFPASKIMILSNLFTAFLGIASVSASQSFSATNVSRINEPSKRGESLPRDGGFFNTGSVSSVSTNPGIYENFGCFKDGGRGKPLGFPLLNLTGAPAETIQSCVNACSTSGQNGIPYTYAGIEPGSCWCSDYISILSVKSSSFCQSSCPSNSGKYCGGTMDGILYMQIYKLRNRSGNVNPTLTTSIRTSTSSSLRSFVESSSLMPQSGSTTSTLTVPEPSTTSVLSITSFSPIIKPTITTNSFGIPPDPPTIPPIVGPTGTESYILPSGSFAYPSEASTTTKPNPWASLSLDEPDYYTTINPDAVPGDPVYTPAPLPSPSNLDVTSISPSTITGSSIDFSSSTEGSSSIATTPAPLVRKFKREYDITVPDSPWLPLLPLTSPEILKEVPPGQVPGWEQQAIAKEKKLKSREYDINAPDSPWLPLLPLTSPEIEKEVPPGQVPGWEQGSITPPPWRPLLPLHTPEILKEVPSDQVPGWQGQSSTPLIPDSDIPPKPKAKAKAKPKGKLHRRQLGPIPENFLEPPGRPDFIKEFPEKNKNKPLPPPFNKLKNSIDPATGKKIPLKKPKYSHSRISLRKRPSLKDIGLLQDGRVAATLDKTKNSKDNEKDIKRKSEWKKINEKEYANKLHLQGIPKAYAEMEEKITRRRKMGQVRDVMEEWEKRMGWGGGKGMGWMEEGGKEDG
ncbi:15cee036-223d-4850-b857-e5ae1c20e5ea-CDS [Sclerotinia trifoliorum]|uniref:15cee036-223d-4850-b857-e5ae1c20e5ea-CDS n=1 Tax=Sclerotinia trifoliorum TaxID=28548 RepID=A0A8H2VYK8_9HELO|nr:15cee036-223d-4850-b857-e5ae1c20e5ea-CDS [Sclerotinia trifoliorum]